MEIKYTLVLIATVAQFILGALWYSPLMFGKWWVQIMEVTYLSKQELQKMQKGMLPFYGLQFLLTVFTTFNLAYFMSMMNYYSPYHVAFWIWSAFIAPIQIQTVVWGNTKKKFWIKQIFVMLSFQLVSIMVAAFFLSL